VLGIVHRKQNHLGVILAPCELLDRVIPFYLFEVRCDSRTIVGICPPVQVLYRPLIALECASHLQGCCRGVPVEQQLVRKAVNLHDWDSRVIRMNWLFGISGHTGDSCNSVARDACHLLTHVAPVAPSGHVHPVTVRGPILDERVNKLEQEAHIILFAATPTEVPPPTDTLGVHQYDMVLIGNPRIIREIVVQFHRHTLPCMSMSRGQESYWQKSSVAVSGTWMSQHLSFPSYSKQSLLSIGPATGAWSEEPEVSGLPDETQPLIEADKSSNENKPGSVTLCITLLGNAPL